MSVRHEQGGPRCVHCHDVIRAYAAVIVVADDGETRRMMLGLEPLGQSGRLFHAQCHTLRMHATLRD